MTDTLKNLANIVLPATLHDVYTAPALTSVMVSNFTLVNTSTSTITASGWLLVSGSTAMHCTPKNLSLTAGDMYTSDEITMGTADKIQMSASSSLSIHCVVSGIEHTT